MKKGIHPNYVECEVSCSCGSKFMTRSVKSKIHVDICSACHPFYTGNMKFVDAAGRVEKFQKKYNWGGAKAASK
jgi:large subunit ribosomal protein L31